MSNNVQRVLIIAGGTGGHVFPAFVVAHQLLAQGKTVAWLGTYRGIENKLVPAARIPLYRLSIAGVRGQGLKRYLVTPWLLVRSIFQSIKIIHRFQPDVVLGMGGYASGPGGIAAWLLHKRLVIHEQNPILGFTNRILSYFATRVLTGFPTDDRWCGDDNKDTFVGTTSSTKTKYVGNPVRGEFVHLLPPEQRYARHTGSMRLLIFGGSQGAKSFNEVIPAALAQLPKDLCPEVLHQAGDYSFKLAKQNYRHFNIDAKIVPFIDDMTSAYDWADLVLCRAGALSIAEISAVGVASILVPLPHAADDHQTYNAMFLSRNDAALLMPQAQLTVENLSRLLKECFQDRSHLIMMAQNAYRLRKVDATEQVIQELYNE